MSKKTLFSLNNLILGVIALGVFFWFYQISKLSPLAGDDWAFHNNAMSDGIIGSALGMYQGWEGRLMTLFSVHFFMLNRSIWEIFNASMYVVIFLIGAFIIKPKNAILYALVFLVVIFTIKDNIRMEVFTWTTGSVYYGIPLLISVIYVGVQYWLLENSSAQKPWFLWIIAMASALYLPLGMENIAIGCLGLNVFMILMMWIKSKRIDLFQLALFVSFVIAYIIWGLSPGSSIRLSQMPEWQSLSLIEKVMQTLPNVLFFTFSQNKYLILILSTVLVVYNWQKGKGIIRWAYSPVLIIAIGMTFTQRIALLVPNLDFIQILADEYSYLSLGFWFIYALVLIANIVHIDLQNSKVTLTPMLFVAVLSSASLLMSPVIGYRLMVYSVFYLMFVIMFVINQIQINKIIFVLTAILSILLIVQNANILRNKYQTVHQITQERLAILADYKVYYEQYKDGIWLPRYPIYTIHGGDIEIEDAYHMKAFKTYFDLPQNETLIFYWKDSY